MRMLFIIPVVLLPLTGCHVGVALMVLEGMASAATVADHVLNIDVSLTQDRAGKTPIVKAIVP